MNKMVYKTLLVMLAISSISISHASQPDTRTQVIQPTPIQRSLYRSYLKSVNSAASAIIETYNTTYNALVPESYQALGIIEYTDRDAAIVFSALTLIACASYGVYKKWIGKPSVWSNQGKYRV